MEAVMKTKQLIKVIKAEVWSRVVGYYRPVRDYNLAKKAEYHDRHQMSKDELKMKQGVESDQS